MAMIYNFQEVYEIGLQIERNGLAFYRHFAGNVENKSVKDVLSTLAGWEERHAELFESLRKEASLKYPGVEPVANNSEASAYLHSLADSHVFLGAFDIEDLAKELTSPLEVLNKALEFEKDSVELYRSIAASVPDSLGKESISALLKEEMMHVDILNNEIKQIIK